MSLAKRSAKMSAVNDYGKKRPNGGKIVELRRAKELKQGGLADEARISVRLLRDIERNNHPVPTTTITAIAAVLKVSAGEITLSSPGASPTMGESLLKLTAVRSATKLSALAEHATKYEWKIKTDASTAIAADMQAVMTIVQRLVAESVGTYSGPSVMEAFGTWGPLVPKFIMPPLENLDDSPEEVQDEFDREEFGEIARLARLQDLITRLRTNGVNVIAGTYTYAWLRNKRKREIPSDNAIWVRVPAKGKTTLSQIFQTELVLSIYFVPGEVEEEVVSIKTGPSLEDFERDFMDDEIPFEVPSTHGDVRCQPL
jgi:transcriptional regulator with XRE-family HTH domain